MMNFSDDIEDGNSESYKVVRSLHSRSFPRVLPWVQLIIASFGFTSLAWGQTASTGAITGIILDPTGSVLPGVLVRLTSKEAHYTQSSVTNENGWFGYPSLP